MDAQLKSCTTIVVVVTSLLLSAVSSYAAESCKESETLVDCWKRVYEVTVPPSAEAEKRAAVAQASKDVRTDLAKRPAGQDTGDTTLQSTTKNFNPLAALSMLLGQAGKVNDQGQMVFDLNFLLPGGITRKNAQLQAIANTKPEIADAIKSQLPEAMRDDLAAKLGQKLTSTDDVTFNLTYNLEGKNQGRSFDIYRARYVALTKPFIATLDANSEAWHKAFLAAREEVMCNDLRAQKEDDPGELTFQTLGETCGLNQATRARARVAEAAAAFADPVAHLRTDLTTYGLDKFAALINNQPQFHLTLQRKERDPLIGGNVTSGKVTYEWARVNFKASLDDDPACHKDLDRPNPDVKRAKQCAEIYRAYVEMHAAEIDKSERINFSFEFEDVSNTRVPIGTLLPLAGLSDLNLQGAKKRIGSLGYSRNFTGTGGDPIRLDIVANYEDVTGDPMRQNRLVASATFTRKVGGFTVPFGIVYANKGEYLGEVDQLLSAHVGLKFDLTTDSGTTP